jgi:hypothetical protein
MITFTNTVLLSSAKKFFKIKKKIPTTKNNLLINIKIIKNYKTFINNTLTHLSFTKQLLLNETSLESIKSVHDPEKFWNTKYIKKLHNISDQYEIIYI